MTSQTGGNWVVGGDDEGVDILPVEVTSGVDTETVDSGPVTIVVPMDDDQEIVSLGVNVKVLLGILESVDPVVSQKVMRAVITDITL